MEISARVIRRQEGLDRLARAMKAGVRIVRGFLPQELRVDLKGNDGPVTDVEQAVNQELLRFLVREGEGWLSEETPDDPDRLGKQRVWIVDPLDGTREFVAGIPEYCISIALVEDGQAVAGGICNPATNELFLGSRETGVTLNGTPVQPRPCADVKKALVLASRSEVKLSNPWDPWLTNWRGWRLGWPMRPGHLFRSMSGTSPLASLWCRQRAAG
jgi:fructose-1,6-bisphosphatase/inositol monophosphatase family enzyme